MKISPGILLNLAGLVLSISFLQAQLPGRAEDIAPLLYGETIPDSSLISTDGSIIKLSAVLAGKPAVLIFYRGGWCPYCNTQLANMQGAETEIVNLGYRIVAVSPDSPESLKTTGDKQNLAYSLYSDPGGALMTAAGIAFSAPERYAERLKNYSDGTNPGVLPVPSVFVVDKTGKIFFEYINPDYRTRLSAGLLLAVLKELTVEMKHE